jgi:hypothetical protein
MELYVVIAIAAIVFIGIILASLSFMSSLFAKTLVRANRQPIIKTPADYGMKFDKVEFKSEDGVTLRGWLIPGTRDTLCIMTHPMNFTKYGYSVENQGRFKITNIEVEFLKTVKSLNEAGHSVLMFDFRNHGESDDSPDKIFGLGEYEWLDVSASLDYVNRTPTLQNKKIFFVSYCTGANATIIAMNKVKEKFKNVKCMLAVQPISMDVFVSNFMNCKYRMLTRLIPRIKKKVVKMGGLPFEDMTPRKYVENIFLPIMYAQVKKDKWTDMNYIMDMYNATPKPKEIFIDEEHEHRFDMYNCFADHPEKMHAFINKYVK